VGNELTYLQIVQVLRFVVFSSYPIFYPCIYKIGTGPAM